MSVAPAAGAANPVLKRARSEEDTVFPTAKRARQSRKSIVRRYPPISLSDTIGIRKDTEKVASMHGEGNWFLDEEIIKVHAIVSRELLWRAPDSSSIGPPPAGLPAELLSFFDSDDEPDIYLEKSVYGKAIVQQQGVRGCTAACACMLIADHRRAVNIQKLRSCNLGNNDTMSSLFDEAGLTVKRFRVSHDLDKLAKKIAQFGSSIIHITDTKMGGHVVIVDAVENETVRIREPYHGWQITITAEALKRRLKAEEALYI